MITLGVVFKEATIAWKCDIVVIGDRGVDVIVNQYTFILDGK